jgi:DNA-binding MarR family transcriptional regulator
LQIGNGPRRPVSKRLNSQTCKFTCRYYVKLMSDAPDPPMSPETAVTELSLAIGQLVRRLRMEANSSELTWSQTATLARLDKLGWTTTADLARAESVKPQSMGATLADLEQEGLVQRRPHPTDGRQVLFELTAAGIEARRKRNLAKREWLLAAMEQLDPDEQQTLLAAAALIRRLAES